MLSLRKKNRNRGFMQQRCVYILYGRPLRAFPDFSIYLQSTYSVYRKDLLMGKLIFAMFNPENICVEVNLAKQLPVSFDHQKCDTSIHLNNISNIYYLTRFTKKQLDCMLN